MGNSDICSDINDIEELQSEEGDAPIRENANPIREDYNFIREQNPILGSGLDLIGSAKLPMLFLDSNLLIEYISAEANSLFRGYYHLERKPFFNV
ncbi:phosphohydrolase, partial [Treponema pallidum]